MGYSRRIDWFTIRHMAFAQNVLHIWPLAKRNATAWLFNIASQKPNHFPVVNDAECIAELRLEIIQKPSGYETSLAFLNSSVVVSLILENPLASKCFSARRSGESTQVLFSISALYSLRVGATTSLLDDKLDSHRCHLLQKRSRRDTQEVW